MKPENPHTPPAPDFQALLESIIQHAVAGKITRSEGTARRFFQDIAPQVQAYAQALSDHIGFETKVELHKQRVALAQATQGLARLHDERNKILKLATELHEEGRLLQLRVAKLAETTYFENISEQLQEFWPADT